MAAPLGALLTGGAGRRMGGDKGSVQLGGEPLGAHAARALSRAVPQSVQVGKRGVADLDWRLVPDRRADAGPAAGIEAVLYESDGPVVVCALDLPFVEPGLLRAALRAVHAGALAAVPYWSNRWHPLCGAYAPDALGFLSDRLDRGDADLQGLCLELPTLPLDAAVLLAFGDPARQLFNVNTAADLERAEAMLRERRQEVATGDGPTVAPS